MKLKNLAIFLLSGALAVSVFAFAGCTGGGSSDNSDKKNEENENGGGEIADPTGFDNIATFYLNDGKGTQYQKVGFNDGTLWTTVKSGVAEPTRSGYLFSGWYKDEACTEQYGNLDTFDDNVSVYAKWITTYTLEAEWANIDPEDADSYTTYSNNDTTGKDIIKADDTENKTASNGYYVDGLWMPNCYLAFEFTVSEATNVTITLRLSSKYGSCVATGDEVCLLVNPDVTGLATYDELLTKQQYDKKINLPLNITATEMSSTTKDFENYSLSETVSLEAGKNVIWIFINNNTKGAGGTMYATAPIVDCMYINSANATIEQIKYNENLTK